MKRPFQMSTALAQLLGCRQIPRNKFLHWDPAPEFILVSTEHGLWLWAVDPQLRAEQIT